MFSVEYNPLSIYFCLTITQEMKISYNWLKEYLELDQDPEELSVMLTDCGLEVEGVEEYESVKGSMEGLVVGEVRTKEKHSNADKLSVTTVDVGKGELLPIVCGAPNVAVGQKVIVAPPGTTLYPIEGGPFKIKETRIRGEVSMGMICAEDEVGLGSEHDGIMVLDAGAEIGAAAKNYFDVSKDTVFDIGLTPNRIDAASHLGVARDLVAVLAHRESPLDLKRPSVDVFQVDNHDLSIEVQVEDGVACPRYSGLSITGLKVSTSPQWLQNRLHAIGLSPINNVVDITNFVLHETGQPLHAFDAAKIEGGKVLVRKLEEGTPFTTLDEVDRKLSSEDLMICNSNGGMCIAGVFGGVNSGVTSSTSSIFLESAYFDPGTIRKTAKRHDVNTDASFRFERGADPNLTVYALKRAALLMKEIAGGSISSAIVDVYPKKIEDFKIRLNYDRADQLIGYRIRRDVIKRILTSLEIEVTDESDNHLEVLVPPYRVDVTREVDLVEEVLRIYGYNNIEISGSGNFAFAMNTPSVVNIREMIAGLLSDSGFSEIMNNSISRSSYYGDSGGIVAVMNPLNSDLDVMRKTLLYGGLESIVRNQNHQRPDVKFYEFGKSYFTREDGTYGEEYALSILVSGAVNQESWNTDKEQANYYFLKGAVDKVIAKLGISKPGVSVEPVDTGQLRGEAYNILKKNVVKLGELKSVVLQQFDIKNPVFYAIFNWDNVESLMNVNRTRFKEMPRYPAVRRDLALLVDSGVRFEDIDRLARREEKKLLKKVNLFDVYEGDKINKGKKSYAVSYIIQDESKTLKDAEVDKIMEKLIVAYKKELGAEIR